MYYFVIVPGDQKYPYQMANLNVLCSYAYWKNVAKLPYQKHKLIIDSGAFSINNEIKGHEKLSLDGYIKFLINHAGQYQHAFTYDAIEDAETSYDNFKKLEERKLRVIPIFHNEEPFKWLQRYIDEGYKYIGLGGHLKNEADAVAWYNKCFSLGAKKSIRFHGLGCGAQWAEAFPFYSIDARTHQRVGMYGEIQKHWEYGMVRKQFKGKPNYRGELIVRQAMHMQWEYEEIIRKQGPMYYGYFKKDYENFRVI